MNIHKDMYVQTQKSWQAEFKVIVLQQSQRTPFDFVVLRKCVSNGKSWVLGLEKFNVLLCNFLTVYNVIIPEINFKERQVKKKSRYVRGFVGDTSGQ